MRRRIVLSVAFVALVVAGLLAVPLAVVSGRYLEADHRDRLQADAQRVVRYVDGVLASGATLDPEVIREQVREDRRVVVELAKGQRITVGGEASAGELTETIVGDSGARVRLSQPRTLLEQEQTRVRLGIGGLAVLAVLVALGVAILQARRVSRPLVELAATAQRIGSGEAWPRGRRYGIPEVDRVAEVLDAGTTRIEQILAAERQFAADASHQLRTPLAALSMRLEEIVATHEPEVVRAEAGAALQQVERLTEVVDRLLTRSGGGLASERALVDVDAVVAQQVAEWQPAFRRTRRRLEVGGERSTRALATPGTLSQVIATLLENALAHGAGRVHVFIRSLPQSVVVEVTDEGPGVPAELANRVFERAFSGRQGTGLGLSVARDLAESDGGRLELVQHVPAVFALFLARADASADRTVVLTPR